MRNSDEGVDPASRRAGIKQLSSVLPDLEALLNLAEEQVIEQDRVPALNAQLDVHIRSTEQSPPSWIEINRNDERWPDSPRLFVRRFPASLIDPSDHSRTNICFKVP
jgi:hypothetical protein